MLKAKQSIIYKYSKNSPPISNQAIIIIAQEEMVTLYDSTQNVQPVLLYFFAHFGTDINETCNFRVCTRSSLCNHTNVRLFIPSLLFLCAFVLNLAFYLQHSWFFRVCERSQLETFSFLFSLLFSHSVIIPFILVSSFCTVFECPVMPASLLNTLLASAFTTLTTSYVALSKQKVKRLDKCTRTHT